MINYTFYQLLSHLVAAVRSSRSSRVMLSTYCWTIQFGADHHNVNGILISILLLSLFITILLWASFVLSSGTLLLSLSHCTVVAAADELFRSKLNCTAKNNRSANWIIISYYHLSNSHDNSICQCDNQETPFNRLIFTKYKYSTKSLQLLTLPRLPTEWSNAELGLELGVPFHNNYQWTELYCVTTTEL